jgi:hypothetical protein
MYNGAVKGIFSCSPTSNLNELVRNKTSVYQKPVLQIRIRGPVFFDPSIRDPGWKNPWSGIKIPDLQHGQKTPNQTVRIGVGVL